MKICYKKGESQDSQLRRILCASVSSFRRVREQMQFDFLNGVLDNNKARSPTEASWGFGPGKAGKASEGSPHS